MGHEDVPVMDSNDDDSTTGPSELRTTRRSSRAVGGKLDALLGKVQNSVPNVEPVSAENSSAETVNDNGEEKGKANDAEPSEEKNDAATAAAPIAVAASSEENAAAAAESEASAAAVE